MLLHILADEHIRLETAAGGAGLAIDGENFGPLQMLAASLALCTASVIQAYAETAHLDLHEFAIEVRWEYVEDPYRVGRYDMTLHLPEGLSTARHRAIGRVANTCSIHNTLQHPPAIHTKIATLTGDKLHGHVHHHHHAHHHHDHQTESSADDPAQLRNGAGDTLRT